MFNRRSLVVCALVASSAFASACGATTYDDSRIAQSTTVAAVVTIPQGSASELLPRLADEMAILSSRIGPRPDNVAKPDGTKIDQLTVIEAIWTAAVNEVEANDPEASYGGSSSYGSRAQSSGRCRQGGEVRPHRDRRVPRRLLTSTSSTTRGAVARVADRRGRSPAVASNG